MSLQDDLQIVYNAVKGSSHSDWPDPVEGEERYPAFEAFRRICEQINKLEDKIHQTRGYI